ncbi:hypothetical protein LCGC14_2097770 [marine sediment metagenome]|uniref:Uncharacterized protein n=1 Tax=marine sediment metagenome TaxID=412755 RepID=A0A0F9EAQ6_9ZZZZ
MEDSTKVMLGAVISIFILIMFLIINVTYYNNYIQEQDRWDIRFSYIKEIHNITEYHYSFNVTYHEEEGYFTLSED